MSDAQRYKPPEKYGIKLSIVGGYAVVDFPLVAASDYDQLKADNEAYKKLHDWLKAEKERLEEEGHQQVARIVELEDLVDQLMAVQYE